MSGDSVAILALNAGQVSKKALHRVDLARMRLAAERQENILPSVLGRAYFRPGMRFLDNTLNNEEPEYLPFVFNASTKALVVVTTSGVQVKTGETYLTRPSVSSAITNGTFNTDLTGWTDLDEAGATSAWITGGYMSLRGTGRAYAIREQQVTVSGGDIGVRHGIRVSVVRGPVRFWVGTGSGNDDYLSIDDMPTGEYSLSFVPTGNFWITISASSVVERVVDSVTVEAAGRVTFANPWGSSFQRLRYAQSGDIIYVACDGKTRREIRRYSQVDWAIVEHKNDDGPFRQINLTGISITPSATVGLITLTASSKIFKLTNVGSIYRLAHVGQRRQVTITAADTWSEPIKITGLDSARTVTYTVSGTFSATVRIQRSIGLPGDWSDTGISVTGATSQTWNDELPNQIIYYRIGVKVGEYTSGTITASIAVDAGIQRGVCRVIGFTNQSSVPAEVLSEFGEASATLDWEEGVWSDRRGFPSEVKFHDGRLWWFFGDRVYGSVSDGYNSFSDAVIGDSAPVIRSVATGPVEGIRWALSLSKLACGTATQEVVMGSSAFDEPITATKFTAREVGTRGCADLPALKVDGRGVFVHRNLRRIFELVYSLESQSFTTADLTRLAPDICDGMVVSLAVQRQPDTRLWFVLADGTAACLIYEPSDDVVAWIPITRQGLIKRVAVLPGEEEDDVLFAVSFNGFMNNEKLSLVKQCIGGNLSRNLDSHVAYTGSPATSIPGLGHLNGIPCKVWADGAALSGTFTPSGGSITLSIAASNVIAGPGYDGTFISTKLAYGAPNGSALNKLKRVDHVTLAMSDVSIGGVKVGRNLSDLRSMPATYRGRILNAGEVLANYDEVPAAFNGGWGPDERICFTVTSPHCATFNAVVLEMRTNHPAENQAANNGA